MRFFLLALLILLLTACGSSGEDIMPPTIMQLPTLPPSPTPPPASATPSPTLPPTLADQPSATPILPAPSSTAAAQFPPTFTPRPSVTPNPASPTPVQIVIESAVGAYARSGPDTTYPIAGEVDANAVFDAVAFTVNAQGEVWYLIRLPNEIPAWVSQFVAARVDNAPLGQIAMAVTVPPSPTFSPTPTLTVTPTLTPTPPLPPGANARIYPDSRVNLRSGPSLEHPSQGLLEPGAPLTLIGRNESATWVEANTFDGRSGWILGDLVIVISTNLVALPVTWTAPEVAPNIILDGNRLENARAIYAQGSNRADSFIVIGDSTSAYSRQWLPIFTAFREGTYNLGIYPELQQTIDFYRPSGVFGIVFQTAKTGYLSSDIFDPAWADPDFCAPGETPLACEYRLRQPAAAIIYIGIIDMVTSDPGTYARNIEATINALLNLHVIPVLCTVTIDESAETNTGHVDTMRQMNAAIRDLAARYELPLIDVEQAANALPNEGTLEDGRHLSFRVDGVLNFNGDERIYGKDMRELLTLQLLEALRVHVYGG